MPPVQFLRLARRIFSFAVLCISPGLQPATPALERRNGSGFIHSSKRIFPSHLVD
jgi:hypothetical protein